MKTLLIAIVCMFPIPLVAQTDLTIHVDCSIGGIVDDNWTLEITVNDGHCDHTVTVTIPKHSDSSHAAASIAKQLNREMGREDFTTFDTEHASSSSLQGEDVVVPEGVTVESVVTRKEGAIANDHIKVYRPGSGEHIN